MQGIEQYLLIVDIFATPTLSENATVILSLSESGRFIGHKYARKEDDRSGSRHL